jgi:hypothetical protein
MKNIHMVVLLVGFTSRIVSGLSLDQRPRLIDGVAVQRTKLLQGELSTPYCFSVASTLHLNPRTNFLATQVWPSARWASFAVQKHVERDWKVCEFGCGPGLPALTAASQGCSVLATDLDEFALSLVQAAGEEQGLDVKTLRFDLIADGLDPDQHTLRNIHRIMGGDKIDLILFSDVFENERVARGAAHVTKYFLQHGSRVWTFAQSDRSQREAYIAELNQLLERNHDPLSFHDHGYDAHNMLWLCDLDETKVVYG